MLGFCLRPIRFLAQCFTQADSPRQMALGFALGILVGLVPKGNLTAVALMTLVGLLRVNLAAATLAAFAFSWAAVLTDPLAHRIGTWLLHADPLVPIWTGLYNLPVVPWTRFNNTVVLGSVVVGLLLLVPTYLVTEPLFERYMPRLSETLMRYRVVRALSRVELAGKLGGI